ncbi:hypothetical protein HHK36_025525 [Tetracentron sinense]|uniref:Uncharacterized protein n=1 Tax=Tetracentron sinense TaxID=13715 RepID=A0A834YLH2_TETSI|nr:hypothetical protein HHK36_025525 [Tetracentron sinense]
MDVVAFEPANGAKSPDFGLLIGGNYQIMLKESIDRFLAECRKGISDFSGFGSIFFRLLQARVDPPLEVIWFYCAVSSRSSNLTGDDPLNRVLMAKDLFQLLAACSASCNGLKSIAILAPVLFELHRLVVDLPEKKLSLKTEKKLKREIECLIEGIVSYISICCCKDSSEEEASVVLLPCFADLVRVWTVDPLDGNQEIREDLRVFFPLISDEICLGLEGGGGVVSYLAGVIITEAFLLRLCLKFRVGLSRSELRKELRTWAVGSITGFRNCYFFETLVRMLLEPTLPVTSLLGSEDEVFLREVLYDAVILVDYSFLNSDSGIHPRAIMKSLAVTMLVVAHEALQFVRANGDQTKAISYINAFSESRLPSQLIKWVSSQIGMEEITSRPNVSTPQALIKWLLSLEEQGARVFDPNFSKLRAKLVLDMSKVDYEHTVFRPDSKKAGDNILFYIDNKGEEEDKGERDQAMIESMDAALLAAAHTMEFTENDGRRKRKEGRRAERGARVKFTKYHLQDNSVREKILTYSDDDDLNSGSAVENPLSDEDMEEMEQ